MKKFKNEDIVLNVIKAHPKVRFFINSGKISYNNDVVNDGNVALFDFLKSPSVPLDCYILAETGDILLTEDSQGLIIEEC